MFVFCTKKINAKVQNVNSHLYFCFQQWFIQNQAFSKRLNNYIVKRYDEILKNHFIFCFLSAY